LKILIPALAIKKTGGATRHLKSFISAVERVDKENSYLICVNRDFNLQPEGGKFKVLTFDPKTNPGRFWWDQVGVRGLVREHRVDLVLSLLNFGPIRPSVPQVNFQRGPTPFSRSYIEGLSFRERVEIAARRKLLRLTMEASGVVVTPTKAMRDMIRDFYPGMPESKFRVLPHAFDRERFLDAKALPAGVEERLSRLRPGAARILYVSHLIPYKGYDVIIRAARVLKGWGVDFQFIITMERGDWPVGYDGYISMIEEFGLGGDFIILDRVPEETVASLYRRADVFVFPSLCESFGFPMVEAMSSALPVVAAGIPVNMEVCGGGALYYDPLDAEGAAGRVRELIEDRAARDKLRHGASVQLARNHIGWDEYVKRCLSLFNEAAAGQ
jgi:glycosyltransferase involved in cell wall biosynthesis